MQQQQLQYFKRLLNEELVTLQAHPLIDEVILQGEMEGISNHPADSGSELAMNILLQDHIHDNEEKIEAALAAIDEGSYGICKVCQKEIPHERLEMIPTSLTCIDHANEQPLQ